MSGGGMSRQEQMLRAVALATITREIMRPKVYGRVEIRRRKRCSRCHGGAWVPRPIDVPKHIVIPKGTAMPVSKTVSTLCACATCRILEARPLS